MGNLECLYASWFPDGKKLLVAGREPGGPARLFIHELESGAWRPLTPERFELANPRSAVSPDGTLAVASDVLGKLVLVPVDGGTPRPVPSVRPHEVLAGWGADSQSLYVYRFGAPAPVNVDKLDVRTGRRELFKTLTPGR